MNGMKLNEENQGFDLFVLQGDMNDRCPRFSIILLFAVFYSFPSEFFFLLLKSFMYFSQEYSLDYFLHLKGYEEVMFVSSLAGLHCNGC